MMIPAESDSTNPDDRAIGWPLRDSHDGYILDTTEDVRSSLELISSDPGLSLTHSLKPNPDDLAMNHFFNQFSTPGGWQYILGYAKVKRTDPCLDLAMRACGMAALGNVENVIMGHDYARLLYTQALGLLNAALRDPKRSRTDDSLIAVTMLGYYENLTCDSRESIQSWKAHISGATQLLRLRGKQQFKSQVGRLLFRETRAQILTQCIWDDLAPPDFLWEWEEELERHTAAEVAALAGPADALTKVSFDFALLRAKTREKTITNEEAAEEASRIESDLIRWSIDVPANNATWRYHDVEVPDSPHVWSGTVHSYSGHPVPGVWNSLRLMRIMLSRTQEQLYHCFDLTDAERQEQKRYFRQVRRQMMAELCSAIPSCLGHASSARKSSPVLISAHGAIWPLFFAGTCALERVGTSAWQQTQGGGAGYMQTSAAAAQAAWILSRLDFVSKEVGLKWASGIAAVLRGDFRLHYDLLPE